MYILMEISIYVYAYAMYYMHTHTYIVKNDFNVYLMRVQRCVFPAVFINIFTTNEPDD